MPEETADGEMAFHRTGLNSACNNTPCRVMCSISR
jgi:hypothetical protein